MVLKTLYRTVSSVKRCQSSIMSFDTSPVLQGHICKALLLQNYSYFCSHASVVLKGPVNAKISSTAVVWTCSYYLSKPKWIVQFPHASAHSQTYQPSAILEPSARPRVTVKSSLAVLHLKDVNHASLAGARTSFRQSAREALHASEQRRDRGRITTTDIKNIH